MINLQKPANTQVLQKRKNSLAGKLAITLGFVSLGFVILLLLLTLNSFIVQEYATLINESGKIRGGIQRIVQLTPESFSFHKTAKQIDASFEILLKIENRCPLLYGKIDKTLIEEVHQKWLEIRIELEEKNSHLLSEKTEELWEITNHLVLYVQERAIYIAQRAYFIIALFFFLTIIVMIVRFFTSRIIKDKVEYQANYDSLTGLFNRYYFYKEHDDAIRDFAQTGISFALCMIDVDHFKAVNDNYGHDAGDEVLKFLSRTMVDSLRKNDIAVRYGGEEFLLLLRDVDPQSCFHTCERLRHCVEEKSKETEIPITVSIGFCMYSKGLTSADHISQVDKAMYTSKINGRNQTTSFEEIGKK